MLSYPSSRVDEYCCLGPPGRRGHTGGHRVEAFSKFPINGILMNLIMWIIEIWVFLRLQKLPNRASWAPVSFLKGTTWWIHFSKKIVVVLPFTLFRSSTGLSPRKLLKRELRNLLSWPLWDPAESIPTRSRWAFFPQFTLSNSSSP